MLKYVIYMTSHIVVYLLCLHIHIVISQFDQFKKNPANTGIKKTFMNNISWELDPNYGPASFEIKTNSWFSWKRDPEYGPGSIEVKNASIKGNVPLRANNEKDVRLRSKEGRSPHPRTEIEFIKDYSQESPVPYYNSQPHFRIQPALDNQIVNRSDKSEVKKPNSNILRVVPQKEKVPTVGHSRESYLRSIASLRLKGRSDKIGNYHGLSIDAEGIKEIVTYRPRKGLNRVRGQQMPNRKDSKQIRAVVEVGNVYDEPNNDIHKNINYMQNLVIKNENQILLPRAKERFGKQKKNSKSTAKNYYDDNEWYGYNKNKQTTKQRVPKQSGKDVPNKKKQVNQGKYDNNDYDEWQGYKKNKQTTKQRVPKQNGKDWEDVPNKNKLVIQGKNYNSDDNEWQGYKKSKQTTKQGVPKKNLKDWEDVLNKKKLVNQGKHDKRDDDEWQGFKKNTQTTKQRGVSKKDWKDWHDVPTKKKQVNKDKHYKIPKIQRLRPDRGRNRYDQSRSKQSKEDYGNSDQNRDDRGYGKKGRGLSRERGYYSQKKHGYGRKEPKHDYHKEVLNHKNKVNDEHKIHRKSKEQLRERQVESSKKGPYDLRVTSGYIAIDEEPSGYIARDEHTTKSSRHKQTVSYESVQIDSAEYNSDLQEDNKTALRLHHPTVHPKLHNVAPLRSGSSFLETEVFKPYSIGRQLECLREKMSEYAIINQEVIGRTVEYNEIVLWKIKEKVDDDPPDCSDEPNLRASNKKYAEEPPEKKIIFIVHGLSVMGWHNLDCLSKIKRFETLLAYYMENLDCYDIFLIPMANPDGVAKALVTQPWNKNVSPQNACPGVNLDRNFDVGWNGTYTAGFVSSCRQTYSGPMPFSEHESQAIRDIFHKYGHKIVGYLHVHAGTYDGSVFKGDAVLYPKGYNDQHSDDDRYVDLKGDIEEAMRNTSFRVLSVNIDTLFNWYGTARGTSVDYASSVYGIPFAMELVMQVYDDDTMVSEEDKREKNTALHEIWQIVIDVIFDSIYKHAIKPEQP